jgi:hypothetical protein
VVDLRRGWLEWGRRREGEMMRDVMVERHCHSGWLSLHLSSQDAGLPLCKGSACTQGTAGKKLGGACPSCPGGPGGSGGLGHGAHKVSFQQFCAIAPQGSCRVFGGYKPLVLTQDSARCRGN